VLVVLRGYPGYQCPICNRQVGEYLQKAELFKAAGASVAFVYPGPAKDLELRAKEFYADKTIPEHFLLVTDSDYTFTNKYGLRWDTPRETAYPATFVIQKDQKIAFARVSRSHGGRTKPEEALKALRGGQ
jgi:peroxiredoxin